MAAQQLSDGNPEGVCVGQSDDLLGFFGATPVAQQSAVAADATDATTAIALVNEVVAVLVAHGLITQTA